MSRSACVHLDLIPQATYHLPPTRRYQNLSLWTKRRAHYSIASTLFNFSFLKSVHFHPCFNLHILIWRHWEISQFFFVYTKGNNWLPQVSFQIVAIATKSSINYGFFLWPRRRHYFKKSLWLLLMNEKFVWGHHWGPTAALETREKWIARPPFSI